MHLKTIYGAVEIVTHAEKQQKNLRDLTKKEKKRQIKGEVTRQRDKERTKMQKSVKEMFIPLLDKH